jgi:hypothetical protein
MWHWYGGLLEVIVPWYASYVSDDGCMTCCTVFRAGVPQVKCASDTAADRHAAALLVLPASLWVCSSSQQQVCEAGGGSWD